MELIKEVNGEICDWDIAEVIPVGHAFAVSRKYLSSITGYGDRVLRMMIAESSSPIINIGQGYFLPDMNDPIDVDLLNSYIAQEQKRIQTLQDKLQYKFHDFLELE